jgi:hypothetical protein
MFKLKYSTSEEFLKGITKTKRTGKLTVTEEKIKRI